MPGGDPSRTRFGARCGVPVGPSSRTTHDPTWMKLRLPRYTGSNASRSTFTKQKAAYVKRGYIKVRNGRNPSWPAQSQCVVRAHHEAPASTSRRKMSKEGVKMGRIKFLWSAVTGAGAAYLLDPDNGRSRRARLRDQIASRARTGMETTSKQARYQKGRHEGCHPRWGRRGDT